MRRKFGLRPGDFVIFALILLLAGAAALPFLGPRTGALVCEIKQDDAVVRRVRLGAGYQETVTLTRGGVTDVIEIDGKTVRFAEATCPDQVCVRTGTLTRAGQMAVCLPGRVVIRLVGDGQEIDAMAS